MGEPFTNSRGNRIPIGALAKRTGVQIETIRYYERVGLLPKADRITNGRRAYGESDVKRLGFIKRSRDMGFSQDEVRNLLKLADGGASSCSEVRTLATSHLHDIRAKLSDLRRMERVLKNTVSQCVGEGAPVCPVLDALSARISRNQ